MRGASYHAPLVQYPFGRSRRAGRALLAVVALGLACIAAWAMSGGGVRALAGLGLWCACAAAAWSLWRGLLAGQLIWDGGQWSLLADVAGPGDGSPAQWPRVHLDLQSGLLISLRWGRGRTIWLWLERGSDPLRWDALRRAVYSRAPAAAAQESTGAHESETQTRA